MFFEGPRPRSLPRPSPVLLGVLGLAAVAAVAAVVLLSRDDPPPASPEPVTAVLAERRLESQLALDEYGTGHVGSLHRARAPGVGYALSGRLRQR